MIAKFKEREAAIELRKQGYSYSEILKKIPVAKSTLSLWRSVNLNRKIAGWIEKICEILLCGVV